MSGDSGMGSWISSRICEALDQADLGRATASDLEDHTLLSATVQLAEVLESFAIRLAARLTEIGDESCTGERVPTAAGVLRDPERGRLARPSPSGAAPGAGAAVAALRPFRRDGRAPSSTFDCSPP